MNNANYRQRQKALFRMSGFASVEEWYRTKYGKWSTKIKQKTIFWNKTIQIKYH